MPLRDRVVTKADISKLEKNKWIEVKDLIFETEKNVLDLLKDQMFRERKAENFKNFQDGTGVRLYGHTRRNNRREGFRNTMLTS